MQKTILLFFSLLMTTISFSQPALFGIVTEEGTDEPVILGNVAVYKNGFLITGTDTDFDGNYNIARLDPGTYDVVATYIGFPAKRITGVVVYAGKANSLDIQMGGEEINICYGPQMGYWIPLIQQDNTTSGGTIHQIRRGAFHQSFTVDF